MSWEDLDIDEEFSEMQLLSYESNPPKLHEEVDPQEWQAYIQLTKPQGEIRSPTEPTCLCTYFSSRRWKNKHDEGYYNHFHTYMANQWSDQDLEEMSLHGEPYNQEIQPCRETQPPAVNINRDVYPVSNVRVQISMKQKGTDVKGRYENFEIPNTPIEEIFQVTQTLLTFFPKQPRKNISYYTRVQLQNKINGKMQGGRNLSLHNATPEEVADLLREIFDASGWLSPKIQSPKDSYSKIPTSKIPIPKIPITTDVNPGNGVSVDPGADVDEVSVENEECFPEDLCF